MALTTFATIIGLLLFLVSIPLLVSGEKTATVMRKMIEDNVTVRILGGVYVVLAYLTLEGNWSIGTDVAGLFRLLAWLVLIKGVLCAWTPGTLSETQRRALSAGARPIWAVVGVVLGVLIFWGVTLV